MENQLINNEEFQWFVKFFWPSVDEWKIDIEKIWLNLISLNKIFKIYCKENNIENWVLKLWNIRKNCTEADIFLEILKNAEPLINTGAILIWAKIIWLDELWKKFFWEMWKQLALKIFTEWKKIKEVKRIVENNEEKIILQNINWKQQIFLTKTFENHFEYQKYLKWLIQLEEWKEEKLNIWYYDNEKSVKIAEINYKQKDFFNFDEKKDFNDRLKEDFNELESENIKLEWKFIDYYWLAHKYHFSFQIRKDDKTNWKQKILCIVDNSKISDILDILKPWNQDKNLYIYWKATRDNEWKIDKIKIEWFNKDKNYSRNQMELI